MLFKDHLKIVTDAGAVLHLGWDYDIPYFLDPLNGVDVDLQTAQGVNQVGDTVEGQSVSGVSRTLDVGFWGAYALGVTPFWLGLIAIAACVGHIWPVFFGFKGGKGVATAFGAIAPIGWDLTGVMAGTWLLTILLSGYSSLGAIVSALIAPFYVWWFKPQFTFPVSMLSCLILLRHHDNIQRLWRRQETKIWTKLKRKKKDAP